jgi:hypothetical protein
MTPADRALARRARWAYELGRLRRSAPTLLLVVPVVALAALAPGDRPVKVVAGAAVALLALALGWWGGAAGRAVLPGVAAGAAPLVMPTLVRTFHACRLGMPCLPMCLVACVAGGLLGGLIVLRAAPLGDGARGGRRAFLAAAVAEAALLGAMGCAFVGLVGVGAMLVTLVVPAVPALSRR